MNRRTLLSGALAISLLVNLGVIGAIGWRAFEVSQASGTGTDVPELARYLSLDEAQQRRWREAEAGFLEDFRTNSREIHRRRDRLIDEIFAAEPDAARIEVERAEIARLQDVQQRQVIEQLLRERALLDAQQRERLRELLLRQPVGASGVEELHHERQPAQ